MDKRRLSDIVEEHRELDLQDFFNLRLDNGNLEVLLRRSIIESRRGITLSSLASSIIDYEVMDHTKRKGIIGALQIPIHVIGPIKYRIDGKDEETYIPLALVFDDLTECIQGICRRLGSTRIDVHRGNKINVYEGVNGDSIVSYRKMLLSYFIATGIDPARVFDSLEYRDGILELNIDNFTPSPFLYSVNPTIRDIAKAMTGKEDPSFSDYKEKVVDGILILTYASLVLTS